MCGCNKKIQKQRPVSKAKTVLRKMWEKSQIETKPLKVKEINKP
jgi:hypothetical protein